MVEFQRVRGRRRLGFLRHLLHCPGVTSVYGAAGSLVIVLLWVYYSSQAVLIGATFTRVYATHRGAHPEPKENAIRLDERPSGRSERLLPRHGKTGLL